MVAVPDSVPVPTDPAQENIDALDMLELTAFEGQDHQSHIMAHLVFGTSAMVGSLPPVAMMLQKHVLEHIKIEATEQAQAQMQQQPGAAAQDPMALQAMIAQLVAQGMQTVKQLSAQFSGEGQGGRDPLVQRKEKALHFKWRSEPVAYTPLTLPTTPFV